MRTVTVTGRGTAREVPDTVVVRVASSHRATGVAEALAGADSAATEIIAVGREHTEPSRIGSTNLNVWPAYDNEGKPSGFEARHSLSITCTDIASAGDLLAALATKVGDRVQVEGFDCELDYRLDAGVMTILHTGVPPAVGGRGIAAQLTRAALAFARKEGLRVRPACSYAAAFMRRHAQYADLAL